MKNLNAKSLDPVPLGSGPSIVHYPLAVASVFLWIGFVGGISFLEAWLKFQAPGITLPLGLGIGRLVFAALNKVEWVLAIAILISVFTAAGNKFQWKRATLLIAVLVLMVQTLWLLPALDRRAESIINGEAVQPSALHFYYVAAEFIKLVCLGIFGVGLFERTIK